MCNRQRGITIIEQVIGLAVTGVLLSLGMPSYSDYLQSRHIRTQAEAIADGLQLARLEAVRRNEPVDLRVAGGDWTVAVVATNEAVQARSNGESANARVLVGGAAANVTITFNALGRIVSGNAQTIFDVNHATLACSPAGAARCLQVRMTTGGLVRMCDPLLAAGNPQACA
jgi:type IV fimbrial biogenesis protein FimT